MKLAALFLAFFTSLSLLRAGEGYFGIRVVDEQTGRGVPLITLSTTNHLSYTTDSAGWIALDEPGLMGSRVFFHVSGPGYTLPKDGFGFSGVKLTPKGGDTVEVKVLRTQIAERLYRITGQGIYRDSTLLGKEAPLPRPNLFADVMGQDSVQVVPWKGRLLWLWGDTQRPGYPLGNYHSTCAWSDLPEHGGLDPADGMHFEYITDEAGAVAKMLPISEPGAVWLFGLLSAEDAQGQAHLLAHYSRWKDLGTRLEHGIAEFREDSQRFERLALLGEEFTWQHPQRNAIRARGVDAEGQQRDYLYFATPFCVTRVPATSDDVQNTSSYEALAYSAESKTHVWQQAEPPLTQAAEAALIEKGTLKASDAMLQVTEAITGKPVKLHGGSIHWNKHRQRWIMIAVQQEGELSHLGELWYAESSAIEGPWRTAVKIASHPKYSFYNPAHHAFLDQQGGRLIYFEGTYTESFSGNPIPTPRYDYNQLMYRLDLDEPRLKPAKVK
jgi:hypothetical protein